MTTSLDDMVDRAPDGEIEVAGGVFKHAYDGNWKLYLENLCDAAHPLFTHRSSIDAAQQQSDDVHSDGSGEIAIRQMRQNGAPYSFWESQVGIWTYPNGHSYLGDYHDDAKLVAALKDPVFREYIAALEKKKGKEETQRILEVRRWNSNIYPNLSFMSQFQQLRVVHPIAVNRTVVLHLQFPPQGRAGADVPQHHQLRQHRQRHRLAGADRRSRNLQPHRHGPLERRRRMAARSAAAIRATCPTRMAAGAGKNSTSEVYIRNMLDAWLGYMTNGHARTRRSRARGVVTHRDGEKAKRPSQARSAAPAPAVAPPRGRRRRARQQRSTSTAASNFCCTRRGCSTRPSSTTGWRCSRRRLVLGAERARSGRSARHRVADLRRPAAAGDARAAARQPAHVFAGAALAHQPHRRQRHDRGRRRPRRAPCARNS